MWLQVITLLVEQRSPELYAHLLELGVPPSVIAVLLLFVRIVVVTGAGVGEMDALPVQWIYAT